MVTISICTQKGGTGKSTSTVEVAAILKQRGYKVLVIDFDQQCSLSKNIKADLTKDTIYDVLHGTVPIADAIQQNDLFDIIPGSASLSKAEREFVDMDDIFLLSDLTKYITNNYDFLFIDNGPSRNILLTMTYIASDYIIIPTESDESSIDAVVTTQNDLKKFVEGRHHDSHAKIMGYILTKFENTTMHKIAHETLEDLAKENDFDPFVATVSKSIKMSEIKTYHTAISTTNEISKQAEEYNSIVDNILRKVGN